MNQNVKSCTENICFYLNFILLTQYKKYKKQWKYLQFKKFKMQKFCKMEIKEKKF